MVSHGVETGAASYIPFEAKNTPNPPNLTHSRRGFAEPLRSCSLSCSCSFFRLFHPPSLKIDNEDEDEHEHN
jgi:hypothetical protein